MTRFELTAVLMTGLILTAAAQRGPAPGAVHVPPDVLALVCAPASSYEMPPRPLRITGGQDASDRRVYAPGDLVTVNAGTDNDIEVGQKYFVRRVLTQSYRRRGVSSDDPANL